MHQRLLTVILLVGLFFGLFTLAAGMSSWRLPDNQQGYAPVQPIEYSHRLHAGELEIDCKFCHSAAEHSRHAGIPSSDVCMKCHKYVVVSPDVQRAEDERAAKEAKENPDKKIVAEKKVSAELQRLYKSLDLDENREPKPNAVPKSIPWVRVHNLPDYVYFDHSAHVSAGVDCEKCHGPVKSMQRVRQVEDLSMGWCVNCHRDAAKNGIDGRQVNAPTNCAVCHY